MTAADTNSANTTLISPIRSEKPALTEAILLTSSMTAAPRIIDQDTLSPTTKISSKLSHPVAAPPKLTASNPDEPSVAAKKKSSSPIHASPTNKHANLVRYNTRPIRSSQPPILLGERVFTSLVEGDSDDRTGELESSTISTRRTDPLEAVAIEELSWSPIIVDLASPPDSYARTDPSAPSKFS